MTVKELLEQRAKLVAEARKIHEKALAEKRAMTTEEDAAFTKAMADSDLLKKQADAGARFEAIDAEGRGNGTPGREDIDPARARQNGAITDEVRSRAIIGWMAEQMGETPTDAEVDAARECNLSLRSKQLTIPLMRQADFRRLQIAHRSVRGAGRDAALRGVEVRDLAAGAGASGGYITPPEDLVRQLETAMLAYGGIYEQAQVIRTANANAMAWPSANDTGNTGEWLAEAGDTGTTSTDPTFGKTTWLGHKVSSKPILASFELLRDSVFDLPSILGGMLGERIGRAKATAFATGNGAGKPLGLTLSTTLGVTAASGTAITADEILDLIYSIDPAYRTNGCGFLMSDATALKLRKLKDADGQYIWRMGMEAGAPDTLFGYPVHICQEMPAATSGLKSVVFGQLTSYKVREVGAIRLYRLSELYRRYDQDGFIAFHEVDGGLLDAGTHPVKHLIQA